MNTLEKKVGSLTTKDQVISVKAKLEHALTEYKTTGINVPAAKNQIIELEKKVQMCETRLAELEDKERLEVKGKGKVKVKNN